MTFLSLNIEKSCLTQEKDLLEFQRICLSMEQNEILAEMADYQAANTDGQYDSYIASLETYNEYYDSQVGSIESQLEVINGEIESYDKAVQANVKNTCKFSLSV